MAIEKISDYRKIATVYNLKIKKSQQNHLYQISSAAQVVLARLKQISFSDFERVGFFCRQIVLKLSDFYIGAVALKKRRESQGGLAQ